MARVGTPEYVLIGADDPVAMRRHTQECRSRGYPFIADCSQQPAFAEGELIRDLIDGAAILCSNEYESHLIESKTGWSAEEILSRVGRQVTTLGAAGVRVTRQGHEPVEVAAAAEVTALEPTGVGDAFRAGFLAGLAWGARRCRRRAGRVRLGGVRRRDGRHAGIQLHRLGVRQARRDVLRRRRGRSRGAEPHLRSISPRGGPGSAGRRRRRGPRRRTPAPSSGTTPARRRARRDRG